jgi:hypothetical protein
MSTVIIFRANAKMKRNAEYKTCINRVLSNAMSPADKQKAEQLKAAYQKAFDASAADENNASLETAYQKAKDAYEKFLDSVKS